MSVHGLFMLLLASSGAAAAIVVGPLLAHRRSGSTPHRGPFNEAFTLSFSRFDP